MKDYQLTDTALEDRVDELFGQVGFNVSHGRPGKEDKLIEVPTDWVPQIPMAVEIKSTTPIKRSGVSPSMKDLRQLDDYIFELSGEIGIRRRTLSRWRNPLLREQHIGPPGLGITYLDTPGAIPYSPVHPAPYKGIFVFNGPTTKPFDKRPKCWLGPDQRKFAEDRSFCVISLELLLRWVEACESNGDLRETFWRVLHETFGLFSDPPKAKAQPP